MFLTFVTVQVLIDFFTIGKRLHFQDELIQSTAGYFKVPEVALVLSWVWGIFSDMNEVELISIFTLFSSWMRSS